MYRMTAIRSYPTHLHLAIGLLSAWIGKRDYKK
jgi:hypothetical protein